MGVSVPADPLARHKWNTPGRLKLGAFYRRIRRIVAYFLLAFFLTAVSLLLLKKFGQTREENAEMQKITEYINRIMDRIIALGTREEQNEEFSKLKMSMKLEPVRMTLTTAVFRYTGTSPPLILKRIIYNPSNKLNEDVVSKKLVAPNLVKTHKTFRTNHITPDGVEQTLIWIFSELLDVKVSQRAIRGDERKIRAVLLGAIEGLHQMHERGFAHLDLKIGISWDSRPPLERFTSS